MPRACTLACELARARSTVISRFAGVARRGRRASKTMGDCLPSISCLERGTPAALLGARAIGVATRRSSARRPAHDHFRPGGFPRQQRHASGQDLAHPNIYVKAHPNTRLAFMVRRAPPLPRTAVFAPRSIHAYDARAAAPTVRALSSCAVRRLLRDR